MDKCRSCRHYIIKERSGDMCIWGCDLSTCVINDFGKTLNGEPVIVYASELKYCDAADMKTHANLKIIEELENIWDEIRALPDINPDYPMDKTIHISRYGVQEIIYKHLSELKGDHK